MPVARLSASKSSKASWEKEFSSVGLTQPCQGAITTSFTKDKSSVFLGLRILGLYLVKPFLLDIVPD